MRWAARASRIPASSNANANPGSSRVTDSPHEKAIRLLRAEVTKLKELLREATSKTQVSAPTTNTAVSSSNIEDLDTSLTFDVRSETDDGCEISEVSETTIKEEKETGDQSRETEAGDSLNSLASSRISVASNDTLSGNNSIPSTQGSNINSSQAEDALFGPRLHRTGSVHDVKPLPPLRNKKRQYRSHEVLPSLDKYTANKNNAKSANKAKTTVISKSPPVPPSKSQTEKPIEVLVNHQSTPTTPDANSKNEEDSRQPKTHFPYEPFNKRADIVASVTDRLYSTLKKKDEIQLLNKPEPIIMERRNSQSLSELRICSNARKRLFDFSHKALRMSRRLRIGIAVETQTDKISAVRVKEVAIDTQVDIEPIQKDFTPNEKQFRNASIGTEKTSLLCKEASVGTTGGSIRSNDKSVETDKLNEIPNITITRTCGNMTENVTSSYSTSTQTSEPVPPRKKCSSFTKYLKVTHDPQETERLKGDRLSPRVLNISISHDCGPFENEVDGISDDSLEGENKQPSVKISKPIIAPPDLLNNHNSTENLVAHGDPCCSHSPQPNFSVSNTRSTIENHSKTFNKNTTLKRDNSKIGSLLPSAGVIDENKFTSECRDNVKLTNADGAIKSETDCDINQRCDRVSGAPGEVIKEPAVTRSILQSAILKTDTVNPGANNGIGGQNHENPSRVNKSIQVGPPRDVFAICGDFLDDVYVPLPRICVNSEYGNDRWPNMRNLIMGRNENMYPYNIETSPRKEYPAEKKKFTKSVTWKSNDENTMSLKGYGKSIMKKAISSPVIESVGKSNNPDEIFEDFYSTPHDNTSKLYKDNDDSSFDHNTDDSQLPGDRSTTFGNFKGIHCWNDRYPVRKRENRFNKFRHDSDLCRNDTKRCLQYVEATSNFLVEATNLVTALNKSTNKLNESGTNVKKTFSPICNERLQIDDENINIYHNINYTDRHINNVTNNKSPSKLVAKKMSRTKRSLMINDSLVDIDEYTNDTKNLNVQMNSSGGTTSILNDLKFLENSGKVEDAERNLLDSLDRLGNCTKRTSEYFSTMKTRYSRQLNVDHHHSLPSNLNDGVPSPYPRHRRSPSRYLQQLLELRKELVQSTKRDDDIFKHFQVR